MNQLKLTFDDNSNVDGSRALGIYCLARIQSTVITCQFSKIQCWTIDDDSLVVCGILMRINFETATRDTWRDCVIIVFFLPWSSNGAPSFVHVYWMFVGFPAATRLMTNDSSSIPTAVEDGGGVNLGGTGMRWWKTNLIKTVNNRNHDDGAEACERETTLTQNLQLNGFINAPLKSFVCSLTSDFHAVHVLCDVELHLCWRDFAAPQTRLIRHSPFAHQWNAILVPAQSDWGIARARVAE